jgi:hypothetical protein
MPMPSRAESGFEQLAEQLGQNVAQIAENTGANNAQIANGLRQIWLRSNDLMQIFRDKARAEGLADQLDV